MTPTNTPPSRVQSETPSIYRLRRTEAGELVLQGGFTWVAQCAGRTVAAGLEWQDLPTIDDRPQGEPG
jgi:hypothetical protein